MTDHKQPEGTFYTVATVGARTERGGCVTSGSNVTIPTDGMKRLYLDVAH